MAEGSLTGVPQAAWSMVRLAQAHLLILDYDGTLAPFRIERDLAVPDPKALELLGRLVKAHRTRVAVLSGRPIGELKTFLGSLPLILIGENGWEHELPESPLTRHPLSRSASDVLDRAERIAIDEGWASQLERKRTSMVIHTRMLTKLRAHDLEHRVLVAWIDLASRGDVIVERIDGGVEIRARGHDAGTATLWLMSICKEATLGVVVGDDAPDERAFRVIQDFGFAVRVGNAERSTHALGWLPGCDAVPDFLEEWARLTSA